MGEIYTLIGMVRVTETTETSKPQILKVCERSTRSKGEESESGSEPNDIDASASETDNNTVDDDSD